MFILKTHSISLFLLVYHWCTLSALLSNTSRQTRADLEGSLHQSYFRNEKLTLPTFEEQPINCVSNKKDYERYSSSFANVDEELSIVKDPKQAIKGVWNDEETNNIRFGETTTLCWIERITIKEDLSSEPPKRLVFKEYAISFENSATIPENYLDCKRVKGEVSSSDIDVGNTVFYETIGDNTKVSRVVNFTRVRNENGIRIWQHKSIKCGMGSVVSRSLTEWDVDLENPKKRLEIKVGPTVHSLKAVNTSVVNIVDRRWPISMNFSSVDFKFENNNELHDEDFKSNEFIEETTEYASHSAADAMEVTTLDEISPTTWKSTNQIESPILPHQKFVLRIKLVLEHTNEKEDKESLIEVEKNVVLTGNEARFGQADFLEQIRALNRSINLEVIEALFNYTSLGELSKFNDVSWITERSPGIQKRSNIEEENDYSEKTIEEVNGVIYANITESSMTDEFFSNDIGYNMPDIYEDVTAGLNDMLSKFTGKNDNFQSMKSKDNVSENQNPKKSYIANKKNTMKEVGRWWKERTDQIYTGGRIRSTTELTLYKM